MNASDKIEDEILHQHFLVLVLIQVVMMMHLVFVKMKIKMMMMNTLEFYQAQQVALKVELCKAEYDKLLLQRN